jgi:hypothetical protein
MLGISHFRPISRQWSNNTLNSNRSNRMNSPSQISLHSISSPLTHTLVRTEFTYPKAGPTPEQFRLISSRDSLAKFAVPYGPDAIAYAASTSRQELQPPPDFDAPSSGVPSPLSREVTSSLNGRFNPSPSRPETAHIEPTTAFAAGQNQIGPSIKVTEAGNSFRLPAAGTSTSSVPALAVIPEPGPPPSALRFPTPVDRSESRASSFMSQATYATAVESMGTNETDSQPSTPRHSETRLRPVHENTDMTITLDRVSGLH